MSIHRSFKSTAGLSKHRNVLSRVERIARLASLKKWNDDTNSIFKLPKIRNIKVRGKKKEEKVEAEGAAPEAGK